VDANEIQALLTLQIDHYNREFDDACQERHEAGAEQYGAGKFLIVDTLEEAMFEVVDLANYARYTYIKLKLLQHAIATQVPAGPDGQGFISVRKATAIKEDTGEGGTNPA
jgi:hypothetical protein